MKPLIVAAIIAAVAILVLMAAFWALRARMGGGVQTARASSAGGSFYELRTETLEGKATELGEHHGKVALVSGGATGLGRAIGTMISYLLSDRGSPC